MLIVLAGAVAGAILGSWTATIALRWPRGESASVGRSRCDSCDIPLPPSALVPTLSWLAQRGRCRACGARIAWLHPATEAGGAAIGAIAFAVAPAAQAAAGLGFGLALLLLATLDLRCFWLPDRITLPLSGAGFILAITGIGPSVTDAAIGAAAGYLSLTLVRLSYRRVRGREGLGGGDPKLFAAIGAWLGWAALPPVLSVAALVGLAFALVNGQVPRLRPDQPIPFGAMLALAAWPAWVFAQLR